MLLFFYIWLICESIRWNYCIWYIDWLTDAEFVLIVLVFMLTLLPTAERRADRCFWQTLSSLRESTSLLTTLLQLTPPPDQRRRRKVDKGAEALWEGSYLIGPCPSEGWTHKMFGSSLEKKKMLKDNELSRFISTPLVFERTLHCIWVSPKSGFSMWLW